MEETDKPTKRGQRRAVREKCRSLSAEYFRAAGESIARAVIASPEFAAAKTVFLYLNTPTEPDTAPIFRAALAAGKTVCVPKCVSDTEMIAVACDADTVLARGMWGLTEPVSDARAVPRERIDLAVVPCVSADRHGHRLGHGAGYYDRFLEGSGIRTVCLCFEKLISDEVLSDANDIPVDVVISEERRTDTVGIQNKGGPKL